MYFIDLFYPGVSTRSSFDKSIITVSAVDYDAQGAGVVRYSLKDGPVNKNTQPIFGIQETFGILSNKVQMIDYANSIFQLTVNARDRQDEAVAEDANTTVTVRSVYVKNIMVTRLWNMSGVVRKPAFGVTDQLPHKWGCKSTEDCHVGKTKKLISCAVTVQLICACVLAYAKKRFSHVTAQFVLLPQISGGLKPYFRLLTQRYTKRTFLNMIISILMYSLRFAH